MGAANHLSHTTSSPPSLAYSSCRYCSQSCTCNKCFLRTYHGPSLRNRKYACLLAWGFQARRQFGSIAIQSSGDPGQCCSPPVKSASSPQLTKGGSGADSSFQN